MSGRVFVDSAAFFPLADPRDDNHIRHAWTYDHHFSQFGWQLEA